MNMAWPARFWLHWRAHLPASGHPPPPSCPPDGLMCLVIFGDQDPPTPKFEQFPPGLLVWPIDPEIVNAMRRFRPGVK